MRSLLCGALLSLMVGCGSSSTGEGVNRGSSGGSSNGGSGNSPALGGSPGSGATSSSQGGNRTGTGGAGAVSGNGGVASTAGGTGNTAGNGGIMLGVGGGGVITPTGETQCDGIDNDGNGIIDDVDVGSDGVCDCLNIATIGRLGLWSTGTGIFTTWINARSPLGVTALGDQDLTTVNLSQFQVIVLLNVVTYDWTWRGGAKSEVGVASHPYSAAESSALANWVSNGGGLLTTIGYTPSSAELADFNRLLSALDVGYTGWDVVAGQVTNWAPHPVTQGILNIKADKGSRPDLLKHPTLTALAWDPTGDVALAVKDLGSGHIAMWGDEWITYDSEWQNLKDEQVERLWLNLFSWLSPANQCQVPIPPTVY